MFDVPRMSLRTLLSKLGQNENIFHIQQDQFQFWTKPKQNFQRQYRINKTIPRHMQFMQELQNASKA